MRLAIKQSLLFALLLSSTLDSAQVVPDNLGVHWNEGAADCAKSQQPPLQVHAYEPQTYILRQNPCADFEANFLYLLIGSDKALLIDTGAVGDRNRMPLADTVMQLLPNKGFEKLPLLVVHTHKHLDHRAGDEQFVGIPGVQVVGADLDSVRSFFGFTQWPEGVAHLDLGNRVVDVLPAPGHQFCHVVFYDERTALVFSGDFLIPGRLLVDDASAFRQSAVRLIDFLKTRPVSHILGGHIELDASGDTYWFGTQYHPNEHALALSRNDLLALPAAFDHFNGFYARYPDYVLFSQNRILALEAAVVLVVLALIVWGMIRLVKRWRRKRASARRAAAPSDSQVTPAA